jgi:cell division protein FtsB
MYYQKTRRKKNRSIFRLILLIVSVVIILLLVILLVRMNLRAKHQRITLEERVHNLQIQLEDLEEKKDKLAKQIEETKDVNYLERVGKEELDLKKPGEKTVSFLIQNNTSIIEEEELAELGFWRKLFGKFKFLFN